MRDRPRTDDGPKGATEGPSSPYDVRTHIDHPVTKSTVALHRLVASWPTDVRDEAMATLGLFALSCRLRGAVEHRALAEYLTLACNHIRVVGQEADAALDPNLGAADNSVDGEAG